MASAEAKELRGANYTSALTQHVVLAVNVLLPIAAELTRRFLGGGAERFGVRSAAYLGFWCTLIIGIPISYRLRGQRNLSKTALCYILASYVPILLSGCLLFTAPYFLRTAFVWFAGCCIAPLCLTVVYASWPGELLEGYGWREAFLLPVMFALMTAGILEGVGREVLLGNPFGDSIAAISEDGSYSYTVRKIGPDGRNLATSYGFIGEEPDLDDSKSIILVLGDSIPAAGRPQNFVQQAADLLKGSREDVDSIELINAGMGGFSLEQIKRFYEQRLGAIPADYVILSFYVDDVNRPLSYRKENYLYSPDWPEAIQSCYIHSLICKSLLTVMRISDDTFLRYRRRSYRDSFPDALRTVDEIEAIAKKRGSRFAVFNVPRFRWGSANSASYILGSVSNYDYLDLNQALVDWCKGHGVPYYDTLPALAGQDIRSLRLSDSDIHFNDAGHHLMGSELTAFIRTLLNNDHPPNARSD